MRNPPQDAHSELCCANPSRCGSVYRGGRPPAAGQRPGPGCGPQAPAQRAAGGQAGRHVLRFRTTATWQIILQEKLPKEDIPWYRERKPVTTTSSVLASSSQYLNDARTREWISTEDLRRNGSDYPFLFGLPTLIHALDEMRNVERINRLFAEERARNPELDAWFEELFISR